MPGTEGVDRHRQSIEARKDAIEIKTWERSRSERNQKFYGERTSERVQGGHIHAHTHTNTLVKHRGKNKERYNIEGKKIAYGKSER